MKAFPKLLFCFLAIALMAVINALVDAVLHPEIPFFDDEHLIVGGVASSVMAFLCWLVFLYAHRLEKARSELEFRVQERTAQLDQTNAQLQEELRLRKENERSLAAAKEAAEKANMAKGQFLTNMSHELRTPLNGILGMLDLALLSEQPAEQREYLETAQNSADHLLRLINDVLDFSEIGAGSLQPNPTHFSLRNFLDENLQDLVLSAEEKGLKLTWQVEPEVPDRLFGDKAFLSRILVKLVDNGIKFTDQGSVRLGVSQQKSQKGQEYPHKLHFTVADTGNGVPQERQQEIFEAFTQLDSTLTRQYEGTGLGLAICASLVKMLAGEIWLESKPGEGATFHFTACFREGSRKEAEN